MIFPIVVPVNPDLIDRVGVELSPSILTHLHIHGLVCGLLGLLPQPRSPSDRGSRFAASTYRFAAFREAAETHRRRSILLGTAAGALERLALRVDHRQAGNRDCLASGSADQASGLVWRYKDPDNYYIVRANALEDNVVLYKVEKGVRIALAPKGTPSKTYGVKHRVPKQTWSTLSVAFQGNVFTVRFDGQRLFDVEDSTFTAAGKVGLWTKADSVTYFDDFQIEGK